MLGHFLLETPVWLEVIVHLSFDDAWTQDWWFLVCAVWATFASTVGYTCKIGMGIGFFAVVDMVLSTSS